MGEITVSNQITTFTNGKQRISFYDRLKLASDDNYAKLHAEKEEQDDGTKKYSRIRVQLMDYSKEDTMVATANFEPEFLQFLLTQVMSDKKEYKFFESRIFGTPDATGLCPAQIIEIKRDETMVIPWGFRFQNGRGVKEATKTGGSYLKPKSFVLESEVAIRMKDDALYMHLLRVDRFIRAWETSYAPSFIRNARSKRWRQYQSKEQLGGKEGC